MTALATNVMTDRPGDRRFVARRITFGLIALLGAASVWGLAVGTSDTSLWGAFGDLALGKDISLRDQIVLPHIRLLRLLMGLLVGAALAVSGDLLQGQFRNPLADPGIIGVSAGGSFGAVLAIVLGAVLPFASALGAWMMPIFAFVGAWSATLLHYAIATRQGRTSVATMLLAGIALSALTMAMTGVLIYLVDDAQMRDFTFWNMGSLSGSNWVKLTVAAPLILLPLCVTPLLAPGLNGLALGEAAARHMGISVQTV